MVYALFLCKAGNIKRPLKSQVTKKGSVLMPRSFLPQYMLHFLCVARTCLLNIIPYYCLGGFYGFK